MKQKNTKKQSPVASLPEVEIEQNPQFLRKGTKIIFWFCIGAVLGIFLLVSFVYGFFQITYNHKIYPGVVIGEINFGGKSPADVRTYFSSKNSLIQNNYFTFKNGQETVATLSAKQLGIGYDPNLLAVQAYSIGRSKDTLSNISLIIQAYINGVQLKTTLRYDDSKINKLLEPLSKKLYIAPVNAIFTFENGRVTTFKQSTDGQIVDIDMVKKHLNDKLITIAAGQTPKNYTIAIYLKKLSPQMTTDKVNNLGIKELIGIGTSLFEGSIETRIYNVELGASRLNGVIIQPKEIFSFDKAIGDVSSLTGYKQAYVISNGKTVLGDGGGICQVSTTFFRAALNAGLPIIERHGHAYRVHYYEEDSPAGIDATIYTPSVDLKVKNDTGHAILVQALVDPDTLRLTINMYGTNDGREVTMTTPVVSNHIQAPPTLYQDDPTLPVGQMKQIDFSADGATAVFTRSVKKDGKTILQDTYTTVYRPWQAIFLKGTKT